MSESVILRSPGDVVAAIPALLGFVPSDSLVALWIGTPAGTLICTVRLDLDTPSSEITRRLLDLSGARRRWPSRGCGQPARRHRQVPATTRPDAA